MNTNLIQKNIIFIVKEFNYAIKKNMNFNIKNFIHVDKYLFGFLFVKI